MIFVLVLQIVKYHKKDNDTVERVAYITQDYTVIIILRMIFSNDEECSV